MTGMSRPHRQSGSKALVMQIGMPPDPARDHGSWRLRKGDIPISAYKCMTPYATGDDGLYRHPYTYGYATWHDSNKAMPSALNHTDRSAYTPNDSGRCLIYGSPEDE